ncbi:UDP-glucosyltransferase 2-like [Epargyreus clarus]|uniref:UDP-glucosyltransferase 2-like n=1 Tax=Epargyreus clarus TaxID=520877 RepID=UPI003C3039EA
MTAQVTMLTMLVAAIFKVQILSKELQGVLKQHYDLLFLEACVRPALILSHIHKVPVILISSFGAIMGTNSLIGTPNHPLLYPVSFRQRIYNLTFWEKVRGMYDHLNYEWIYQTYEAEEDEMLRSIFGPDIPKLRKLGDNIDMFFVNMFPIWLDNQPMPPNVITIGGLHEAPERELPKDLKSYLDTSKHGVIYMSFGTNIQPSILPPQMVKMMMKVFSELPYDVIWKWNMEMEDKPKNIKLFKWLPQPDLLKHPKLKLFITQGGLQSTEESITAGVPLIGIPMFSDQWYNTEKYLKHGIGLQLELGTFTEEDFKKTIVTVIEDNSFRNNIIKLRTLMYDQPQAPLERAIWWTEYVLRHGGAKHLRAPAANMSWTEYYEVKLLLTLGSIFFTIIVILMIILNYIFKFIINSPNVKNKYLIKNKNN